MSDAKRGNTNVKANATSATTRGAASSVKVSEVGTNLLQEAVEVVRICIECVEKIEQHKSERARIEQSARVKIELIQSRRELMVKFLDQAFAERRQNFQDLFVRLDVALSRDSVEGVREVLGAIITIANSSPFEALRDAASAHEALLDRSVTWEF